MFTSSKSKSTPGYFDPDTQASVDYWKDKVMGKKSQTANANYNPNWEQDYYSKNPSRPSFNASGERVWGQAGPGTQGYEDYKKMYGTQFNEGERTGGLFDQFAKGTNVYENPEKVFTGNDSGYNPTDFGQTGYLFNDYKQSNFSNPNLSTTEINPEMFQGSADLISKGGSRLAASNIQKMQDEAAYQGRGGGDIADFRSASANRDVAASTADQLKKLSSEKMGLEYNDQQDVKRRMADYEVGRQKSQADESRFGQTFADEAKRYMDTANAGRLQNTVADKQFAAGNKMDYLKSKQGEISSNLQGKLTEIFGNKDSLNQLMKILTGGVDAFAEKPSSSSSSVGFGYR